MLEMRRQWLAVCGIALLAGCALLAYLLLGRGSRPDAAAARPPVWLGRPMGGMVKELNDREKAAYNQVAGVLGLPFLFDADSRFEFHRQAAPPGTVLSYEYSDSFTVWVQSGSEPERRVGLHLNDDGRIVDLAAYGRIVAVDTQEWPKKWSDYSRGSEGASLGRRDQRCPDFFRWEGAP